MRAITHRSEQGSLWGRALAVVQHPAPWPAQLAVYALLLQELVRSSLTPSSSSDNLLVVSAVRNVRRGVSPYISDRFLYPPSSVPFALVLAPLSDRMLVWITPFVIGALLVVAWSAALRLFDISLRSWLAVLGLGSFAFFNPAASVVELGSWTAPVACLMAVALLLMGRDRWLAAGVVIGVSIAVKPMLIPIGLVFLLARRWSGFAAAAGIPLALCALVAALLPQPGLFFTKTLPFLLSGQDDYARPFDSSLPAMLPRFGVDEPLVTALRLVVLVGTVLLAVLRWRRGGEQRVRLVDTSSTLMVGTFLVMTPMFGYYPVVVLPVLVASVVVAGSLARSVWFWIALIPLMRGPAFLGIDLLAGGQHRQAFKPFIWTLIVLALLVVATRPHRPEGDGQNSHKGAARRAVEPRSGPAGPSGQQRY